MSFRAGSSRVEKGNGLRRRAALGRKGVVFLIISLLLVSIFLTIIYAQRLPTSRERAEGAVSRIRSMSDFITDFMADVHRATSIAGFRSFIAAEQYISQEGAFITDPAPIFIESFMNGTIDGYPYEIMENSTFGEYLQRVNAEAARIGIELNASVVNITLSQSTPWSVDIDFKMTLNVSDTRGLARWDTVADFSTEVSILDIRDPVYSVYTTGKVPNTIRQSPYNNSQFVIGGNDTTNLNDEITNMYYREDPYAPSFLQRLAGNLTGSSKYGIASLVDLDELNAQGLFVKTYQSVVDFRYFSNVSTNDYCPSMGSPLPSWFKIDQEHYQDPAHDYEVSLLNATAC